jgi:hypothetical protein
MYIQLFKNIQLILDVLEMHTHHKTPPFSLIRVHLKIATTIHVTPVLHEINK